MTISLLFMYSLVCSVGLLLMYGAIRLSGVCMAPRGRVAIIGSVVTVALAVGLSLLTGWNSRPTLELELPASLVPVELLADDEVADGSAVREFSWWSLLTTVYIIGLVLSVVRLFMTIARIIVIMLKSERRDGILLSRNQGIVPFSWGGRIIMSRSDYESDGEMLLAHERAHRDARHWIDLLTLNLIGCLTWYCPAVGLIRRELQSAHEFAADRAVLAAGFDERAYQMLLIRKASGRRFANSVADCINNHSLKSRIIMMQKKTPVRHQLFRALTLVPAAFAVVALASSPAVASLVGSKMPAKVKVVAVEETVAAPVATPASEVERVKVPSISGMASPVKVTKLKVVDDNPIEPKKETVVAVEETVAAPVASPAPEVERVKVPSISGMASPVKVTKLKVVDDNPIEPKKETAGKDEKIFTAVETIPVFEGGDLNMYAYMVKNLQYPEECWKEGIQGRVTVQFVVKTDGSIGEVKVVRGVDPRLDNEAVRIIRTFPKFTPGTMNGEPVNVWYTLPVNFKLQSDPVKTDSLTAEVK